MPRTTFPPTPEASTEIFGKPNDVFIPDETHFALPPSAIAPRDSSSVSSASDKASDSSYTPTSPPLKSNKDAPQRRKSGATSKEDFALPPPPSRKRKIIQMNPHEQPAPQPVQQKPEVAPATGTKRKQGNTTSAGRKVARKTAHSLIERRRRSKMNDEFATLKDMIPACAGQEMHKLAILQASTEYLRYLEQCVADLKSNHASHQSHPVSPSSSSTPAPTFTVTNDQRSADYSSDSADSEDEANEEPYRPQYKPNAYIPQQQPATPPSSGHLYSTTQPLTNHSLPPSPNLPAAAHEEEASAALLMLNALDRRESAGTTASPLTGDGRRGMSVRDLLSS